MLKYINRSYEPKRGDLVAEYYVEPRGISLEKACEHIAAESSIGTWTTISTMNPRVAKKLRPSVYSINKRKREVKIAYPAQLFEQGNMPQILSSIAGNIFGMKALRHLRLQDIHFPKSMVESFRGPKYGIPGVRKLLGIKHRPLVGTIVKPKVGLTPEQHARVAYESWVGGLDIVKDDENLTSMKFNQFDQRIKATLKARDKAEVVTGQKKIYMPNVTSETNEMLSRAKQVKKLGGEYFMVDIITSGWAALQTLREANENLAMVIHAHRAMHAALTKNHQHGISMLAIAKIARLIGVDQLHIGTAGVGKMVGSPQEELNIEQEVEDKLISPNRPGCVLEQNWYRIKPLLAVASGGLHPGSVPKLLSKMSNNIVIQFGGGVHGHPDGTRAGAAAVKQAVHAAMGKISLDQYARIHPELNKALEKWGQA